MNLSVIGVIIALVGSFISGNMPWKEGFRLASGFGGGDEESWNKINNKFRNRTIIGSCLLVIGTALQIYGTLRCN